MSRLKAEVADLRAWKAEAQQRGAEMARRGLEVCAERDVLEVEVERLRGVVQMGAELLEAVPRLPAAALLRAALKGDGQGGSPGSGPRGTGASSRAESPPPQSPRAHRRR